MSRDLVIALLTILAFVGAFLAFSVLWGGVVARPNVLIISLDTFRADHMGFLGARLPDGSSPTPNMDALAARCAGMKEGVTPSPLTLPAHVTVMSGLYPDRHGVRENDSFRVPEEPGYSLLAEDLKAAGYATGAVVSGQPLEGRYGLNAGFGTYNDTDQNDNPTDTLRFRERGAVETTDLAKKWLESQGETPWFLFVHYFDAHDPYVWHGPHDGLDRRVRNDRYRSETMHLDAQVGRLLDSLRDGGKDTLVILLSDHGEGLGDHKEKTHGYTLHQSTMRIPFLLKAPDGVDASAFGSDAPPARLVDVKPTVLAACGVDDACEHDGRDLLKPASSEWFAYGETLYPYYQFQYAHERYVMDLERKLIAGGATAPRLYAWRDDRGEENDLLATEPERAKQLGDRLRHHNTRQRGKSEGVLTDPNAAFPYMGGRPMSFPVEPDEATNTTLPAVETRWEVIDALDAARRHLRQVPKLFNPAEASQILAPFAQELDTNPSLLWWTARAAQLQALDRRLTEETRKHFLERAIALYGRHHAQFKDARAYDARLRTMLLLVERASGGPETLRAIVKDATEAVNAGTARALTFALRAKAQLALGEPEKALVDFKRALKRETDPGRRRQIQSDLEAVQTTLRRLGKG